MHSFIKSALYNQNVSSILLCLTLGNFIFYTVLSLRLLLLIEIKFTDNDCTELILQYSLIKRPYPSSQHLLCVKDTPHKISHIILKSYDLPHPLK